MQDQHSQQMKDRSVQRAQKVVKQATKILHANTPSQMSKCSPLSRNRLHGRAANGWHSSPVFFWGEGGSTNAKQNVNMLDEHGQILVSEALDLRKMIS